MKHRLIGIAAATCALAGCGSDSPDIAGLYATTEHLVNSAGCSGGDTPDPDVPYFRIKKEDLRGATFYVREDCQSTDEGTCESGSGLLTDEITDGYSSAVSAASGSSSACSLTVVTYTAVIDGDVLTFEEHSYVESGAIDPCTPDEAESRGEDMPCISYEHLVGSRQ